MSDRLFNRAVRVSVDDIEVTQLRVQLKIKKTLGKEPNTCELAIFNLASSTRAGMQKRGAAVIVEAGYTDTLSQVFSGDARTIDHVQQGADWVTKVQCGDGERAYRHAQLWESFRPGTTVADVADRVIRAMGLDGSRAIKFLRENVREQFTQGFCASGRASAELDRLVRACGMEWSIQDGAVQILKRGATTSTQILELAPDTGLIGSPEHGSPGQEPKQDKSRILKVKSLLQPQMRPGGQLRVKAEGVEGTYRIQLVTHSGDTHGGEWFSEAECLPI